MASSNTPEYNAEYQRLNANKIRQQRIDRRSLLNEIKLESGCVDCGYDAHPAALDFDHLPDKEKLFGLGSALTRKLSAVLAEIDKCEVVCANCHRIRTHTRSIHYTPYIAGENDDI